MTDDAIITKRERDLMRHAVGWPNFSRNIYAAEPASRDDEAWGRLVAVGLAESADVSWTPCNMYRVTDAGMGVIE